MAVTYELQLLGRAIKMDLLTTVIVAAASKTGIEEQLPIILFVNTQLFHKW